MRSHLCSKTRIFLPSNNARTPIRASLKALVGLLTLLTLTSLLYILSFQHTATSLQRSKKAALHALNYINSMHHYWILLTSENICEMHSFTRFPRFSDVEAYRVALPPKHANSLTLLSYSNACWGSQIEMPLPIVPFSYYLNSVAWAVGLSSRMEVLLVGWLNVRSALSLAPVRQRIGPQILLLKRWSISALFVGVFFCLVFLFLMSMKLQISTMTMTPA